MKLYCILQNFCLEVSLIVGKKVFFLYIGGVYYLLLGFIVSALLFGVFPVGPVCLHFNFVP